MTTILDIGYRSTHYWLVGGGASYLLVDMGWPGSLGMMKANLKRMGVPIGKLAYAFATHYHMDHAGLGEELKREGVPLLVLDVQVSAIPLMKPFMKPQDHYLPITEQGNVVISCAQGRALLATLGIAGQFLHTPGHSPDSVSLLLDDGTAFTGDLPLEALAFENSTALADWQLLRQCGAKRVYPAHGPVRDL